MDTKFFHGTYDNFYDEYIKNMFFSNDNSEDSYSNQGYQEEKTNSMSCFYEMGLDYKPETLAELKNYWRKMVKKLHPDAGGDHDEFIKFQNAYEEATQQYNM